MEYSYKDITKRRRIKKFIASVVSLNILYVIYYFLNYDDKWQFLNENMSWCLGIGSIVLLASYVAMLWILEFRYDPLDYEFEIFEKISDTLEAISYDLLSAGVRGNSRKTYSWPLALPFQLLNLVNLTIKWYILLIGWLASLIR